MFKIKKNLSNFLEMMELLASYNEQVGALILGNAPQNAKYTSHQIQKEILHMKFALQINLQFDKM
jgi:hypothetical protein